MLIFGIISLVTGKFTLTRNKVVYGTPARMVGLILVMPLPILVIVGVMLGFGLLAQGKQLTEAEMKQLTTTGMIIGAVVILACFVAAIAVAAAYGEPARPAAVPRDRADGRDRERRDRDYDDDLPPRRPPDERYR
jgi:hypothetical protein